jgi:hypothetical protein
MVIPWKIGHVKRPIVFLSCLVGPNEKILIYLHGVVSRLHKVSSVVRTLHCVSIASERVERDQRLYNEVYRKLDFRMPLFRGLGLVLFLFLK